MHSAIQTLFFLNQNKVKAVSFIYGCIVLAQFSEFVCVDAPSPNQ